MGVQFKVLEVFEKQGGLTVKVETKYGIECIGLGLESRFLNPDTNKPKWLYETAELLDLKYSDDTRVKKDIDKEYDGQDFDTKDLKVVKPEPSKGVEKICTSSNEMEGN